MDDELFQQCVDEVIETLPPEFKEKLENVSIFVEEYPTEDQIRRLKIREGRVYLLGLYEGIAQTHRSHYGVGGPLPDRITIFKYPILSISRTKEEAIDQIRSTVLHEIGHHFGMDEEEIRAAEAHRKTKKGTV